MDNQSKLDSVRENLQQLQSLNVRQHKVFGRTSIAHSKEIKQVDDKIDLLAMDIEKIQLVQDLNVGRLTKLSFLVQLVLVGQIGILGLLAAYIFVGV